MNHKPLRILAIGSSGSTHVVNRVRCFAERGHTVFLLTDTASGLAHITEISPSAPADRDRWVVTAARLAGRLINRPHDAAGDMMRLILDYRRLVRDANPDIVHVHYAYNTWAWLAGALGLTPLVVSIMGGDVLFKEQGSPTPRGIALTKRLLGSADLITAKSNFLIGALDELGGFGKKAIRVVWGIDPEIFKPQDGGVMRRELGIAADAKVVLSPKILTPFYNIHVLVEAMAHVVAVEPKAHLIVTEYGADQAYRAQLVARLVELGLTQNVTFLGHIAHADMPRFYSIADVAVGIPQSDGLPQTLLEAMACGVPNVIGPLDRYSEIVRHGESALLSPIDPESVAATVLTLLSNDKLRQAIVACGRAIVVAEANFPQDVVRVEEAYYKLVALRRRPRIPRLDMMKDAALYWLGR